MKKLYFLILGASLLFLSSCENEIEPGENPLMEMSNEWWVHLLADDGSGELVDVYHVGYFRMLTSSTASNSADSIFVDDFGDVAELRAKVAVNASNLSFTNGDEPVLERYTDGEVIIKNGKILPDVGRSSSGVQVDSIYFEVEFDWDPGTQYVIAGHARTGYTEDEH
ncbi:MAG TPA: lipid-binding protein [Chryseosolibacter sp.]|nr:lipid-binding protein [Chryseosolibacter sp.]